MYKRVAALDLGTNTFHLIIAELEANSIKNILIARQKHVKLGEGGINKGIITPEAFARGIAALTEFNSILADYQVEAITAIGTAALRSAENGPEFIREVKDRTGIPIEIIDGDREASLIYQGVKLSDDLIQNTLIMDIGGGSVEFIIANGEQLLWKKSYPIGAAKLMAAFHHSDPITAEDIGHIHAHLDNQLDDLKLKAMEFKVQTLIGSAGAFETFLALSTSTYLREKTVCSTFDLDLLKQAFEEIITSNHQKREEDERIIPVRVDMIVVASVLARYIVSTLAIDTVKVSAYALKEGLLLDTAKRKPV